MFSLLYDLFYNENNDVQSNNENNTKNNLNLNAMTRYSWNKSGKKYSKANKPDIQKLSLSNNLNLSHLKVVDLRDKCPQVYDQGKLGSCTANSIGFLYHYQELQQKNKDVFTPSRLFIYYNERKMEGHISTDSGAEIHDGIKSVHDLGVCDEKNWNYDIEYFNVKPSEFCYKQAKLHKALQYQAVKHNIEQFKLCLLHGYPVSFGFVVFESFESKETATSGIMSMPKKDEKELGGHAVALVGYDDDKKCFIVRNSWGTTWGDKGYFYMPYEFIQNKKWTNDFWIIKQVSL